MCCFQGNHIVLKNRRSEAGYGLVGTNFLIIILSMLFLSGYKIYEKYSWINKDQTTTERINSIHEALNTYIEINGRLPCPAPMDVPPDTPTFGQEVASDCTTGTFSGTSHTTGRDGNGIRIGSVPVRTLNIPDIYTMDSWHNRLIYAVTEFYTVAGTNFDLDNGAITLLDSTGNSATSSSGNVIFAVLSPGSDDRGAYNLQGTITNPCDSSTFAGENCNNDDIFNTTLIRNYETGDSSYTTNYSYMASVIQYDWNAGPWNCNAICGCGTVSGTNSRSVSCQTLDGTVSPDNRCNPITKPASTGSSCTISCAACAPPPTQTSCRRGKGQGGCYGGPSEVDNQERGQPGGEAAAGE